MKNHIRALLVIGLGTAGSVANAVPTIYFAEDTSTTQSVVGTASEAARSNFLSTLSGVGNEDFESFAAGTTSPALTFPGSYGSITASMTGSTCVDDVASSGCGFNNPGRWATSGDQFWETDSGGTFGISFSSAISAFGFYGTDIGDFSNRLIISLTDISGTVSDFTVNHSLGLGNYDNALLFWGFQDLGNSYTSIAFSNSGYGGDVFAFDDMVIGDNEQICRENCNELPEPGTLLLIGLGLAGFASRRKGCVQG